MSTCSPKICVCDKWTDCRCKCKLDACDIYFSASDTDTVPLKQLHTRFLFQIFSCSVNNNKQTAWFVLALDINLLLIKKWLYLSQTGSGNLSGSSGGSCPGSSSSPPCFFSPPPLCASAVSTRCRWPSAPWSCCDSSLPVRQDACLTGEKHTQCFTTARQRSQPEMSSEPYFNPKFQCVGEHNHGRNSRTNWFALNFFLWLNIFIIIVLCSNIYIWRKVLHAGFLKFTVYFDCILLP